MKKLIVLVAVVLMLQLSYAADVFYDCGFETSNGFTNQTAVFGKGTLAWSQCYYNASNRGGWTYTTVAFSAWYSTKGYPLSFTPYAANMSLSIVGYSTSRLDLRSNSTTKWYEFAFQPYFASDIWHNGDNDIGWAGTIRSDVTSDFMGLRNATKKIDISWTEIGTVANNQRHTISFQHERDTIADVYTGIVNVYLNGEYVTQLDLKSDYNAIQRLVFSSAEATWYRVEGGSKDSIMLSNSSIFVVPENTIVIPDISEPSTMSLLHLVWAM